MRCEIHFTKEEFLKLRSMLIDVLEISNTPIGKMVATWDSPDGAWLFYNGSPTRNFIYNNQFLKIKKMMDNPVKSILYIRDDSDTVKEFAKWVIDGGLDG